MITPITIKAKTEQSGREIVAAKLKEAYALGWEQMSSVIVKQNDNEFCFYVWLTPQRKDE